MTEVRFSYDERLLDRCVKSSLYQRVIARHDASQTRTTAAAAAAFSSSSNSNAARMSGGGGGGDDDVVEDKQQVAPASDHLLLHRADQAMRENQMEDSDDPQACVALFHEHQDHYYGQQPAATPPATTVSVASYLYDLRNDEAAAETETESSATSSLSPSTLQRFEAFVENVGFVHRHNSNSARGGNHHHRVALNRFSDRRPDEIFPGSSDMDDEGAALGGTSARRHLLRHADPEQADPLMLDEEAESGFDRRVLAQLERDGVVIHLDDAETVMSLSLEGIGKGSMNHLNPKKYEKIYHKSKTLTLDPDEPLRQFETPDVLQELDGAILSIRPEQPAEHDDDDDRNNNNDNKDEDADGPPPSRNPVFVSNDPPEQDEDEFARNLNWATADNPDGVAIVHEPIDQVRQLFWNQCIVRCLLRGGAPLTFTLSCSDIVCSSRRACAGRAGRLPRPGRWRRRRPVGRRTTPFGRTRSVTRSRPSTR
jgi:Cathepsin propeptide inhibitor domain (I29)